MRTRIALISRHWYLEQGGWTDECGPLPFDESQIPQPMEWP